jgi:hypothetical protein
MMKSEYPQAPLSATEPYNVVTNLIFTSGRSCVSVAEDGGLYYVEKDIKYDQSADA